MKYIFILFSLFSFSQTITLSDADILAFPTAEGWGKNTTGGRGKAVFFVTNLNNSGAGSFRQIETDIENANNGGNIIFRTGGIAEITSEVIFSLLNDDISFFGQSAPGDGFTIHGSGVNIRSENVQLRHIKFRNGLDTGKTSLTISAPNQNSIKTGYIFDHISTTWGFDSGNFTISGNPNDELNSVSEMTLQNSIVAEHLSGKGTLLYGQAVTKISIINNAYVNNQSRVVTSTVGLNNSYELLNNYFYGLEGTQDMAPKNEVDAIGNIWINGHGDNLNQTFRFNPCTTANCPPSGDSDYTGSKLYNEDNIFNGGAATLNTEATNALVGSRIDASSYNARASSTVKQYVLDNAGARRNLEGLDNVDQHQMDDLNNGTTGAFYSTQAQTVGLPSQASGTPYPDSDNDGLSDAYEAANGGTVTQSVRPATAVIADGRTVNQSGVTDYATTGYTHLEIFMADLAKDWDGYADDAVGGTAVSNPRATNSALMNN